MWITLKYSDDRTLSKRLYHVEKHPVTQLNCSFYKKLFDWETCVHHHNRVNVLLLLGQIDSLFNSVLHSLISSSFKVYFHICAICCSIWEFQFIIPATGIWVKFDYKLLASGAYSRVYYGAFNLTNSRS